MTIQAPAIISETVTVDDWQGCYKGGWQDIDPDAFAHPAKYSRALIRRIYEHVLSERWLRPGDTVIDPFGGVALGALDAMRHGLRWIGCELEPRFVELGNKNIELWRERFGGLSGWGSARLVQGDSRQLTSVIESAGVCVSSPPFLNQGNSDQRPQGGMKTAIPNKKPGTNPGISYYGSTEGNLGNLTGTDESLRVVISSPPYSNNTVHGKGGVTREEMSDPARCGRNSQAVTMDNYGDTPGNLGTMKEGDHAACVISSPPFVESLASDDPEKRGGLFRDPKRKNDKTLTAVYGQTPGQLGAMRACISSPPYESAINDRRHHEESAWERESKFKQGKTRGLHSAENYGETAGNIGNSRGDDFWSAARLIVEQVYQVLQPGGKAIWVVKAFVRNKQIVDFPGQWQQLCETVGFRTLHIHRAWLVEQHGTQQTLTGEDQAITTARKSFFRRLAESKGSPAIDFETVLCCEKAADDRLNQPRLEFGEAS